MKSYFDYKSEKLYESLTQAEDDDTRIEAMSELMYNELQRDTKLLDNIDEGLLGDIFAGTAGYFIGPLLGKVIANCLGITQGIVYDMFTSKLVSIALSIAISKYIAGKHVSR